jgi:formate hydrogenlyase transcriptional activator
MSKSSKTGQQLFLEREELIAKLGVSQQGLQEATEGIQERKRAEEALQERLRFETLLAELSAHFINLPADQIDREIESAQRRICEFLDLDRSTLWQVSEGEPGALRLTHIHQPPESKTPPARMNIRDFFPWTGQKVMGRETLTISKMTGLPPEADRDRENYRAYGTKSGVYVPLSVGEGPVFGLLTFAVTRQERSWPETVVMGFKLIAQVFASTLARQRAEQALRESESRLSMATSAAGTGLWIMEADTGHVWVTPKTRELFLFAPDEELNYESFFKVIHPEDRERVHQTVQQALRSGENFHCDYRIVQPDGGIRWIVAHGQRHFRSAGESDRLMGVSLDITARKLAEQALEERLQFEHLLSDLSSRFVNIPSGRVDSQIELSLRLTLEFFRVDRCALFQILRSKNSWRITHVASSDAVPSVSVGVELPRSIYPWTYERLAEKQEVQSFSTLDYLPAAANVDRQTCIEWGIRSFVNIPILLRESVRHIIHVSSAKSERVWPEELFPRLQLLGEIFVNALEMKELKQRLENENVSLREEVQNLSEHEGIVGQSPSMKSLLAQVRQVAGTDATVLIQGETGTGKELLARAIHRMSGRGHRPMVTVNCVSLPPALIDCELFGRERGAYTGALAKMIGRFEIADGSTIFLDEIGEIPIESQSKLLRVLQEGTFERLGSTKIFHTNVRIIVASNRSLEQAVKEGKFRSDLFYRLNVFPILVPPLRERPEDIPLLVWTIIEEFQKKMGKRIDSIPGKDLETLKAYSWPGNIRELRNVIERAIIISNSPQLHIPVTSILGADSPDKDNLQEIERGHILSVLEKTNWRIMGKGGAAEILGLKRTTLQAKMKKLGLTRPKDLPK